MKKARMIVNIAMTVVLLCLMAYTLVGETAHEVWGTVMFILFIIHHILNRKWFGAVTKGRYNSFRVLQTTLVFLMILSVLASVVSGIMLSNKLYTFLPRISGMSIARSVHMVCAYLNFILMSLHLGLHWNAMMSAMIKKRGNGSKVWILRIAAFGVAIYGIYAFVNRQIGEYLFLRTHFLFLDPSEPLILFFIDYVAIMGLFVFIGHYFARLLRQVGNNRKTDQRKVM